LKITHILIFNKTIHKTIQLTIKRKHLQDKVLSQLPTPPTAPPESQHKQQKRNELKNEITVREQKETRKKVFVCLHDAREKQFLRATGTGVCVHATAMMMNFDIPRNSQAKKQGAEAKTLNLHYYGVAREKMHSAQFSP
jgi:hypothetical protein